jgi:3-hydroxymyristoyl/3-hydroxydecanoyl-(acyl carrier protein) dehydratase
MKNIINKIENNNSFISFTINSKNEVFIGHFPDYPILPGVFELYIIEKIIEYKFKMTLSLLNINIVKFLNPIFPVENEKYFLLLNENLIVEDNIYIDCEITNEKKNVCSFKGTFKILNQIN